jgi:hypothetical protein
VLPFNDHGLERLGQEACPTLRRVGVDVEIDLFRVETDFEKSRSYTQDVGAGITEAERSRYR